MPRIWRFLPRLVWSLGKRASGESALPNVEVRARLPQDPVRINQFANLVGHREAGLPPTWPAGVVTPLLTALVSHPQFPFPAIGLIHRQEEISVLQPIKRTDELRASLRLGECRGASGGVCFDIHADIYRGTERVWASRSEILYRRGAALSASRASESSVLDMDAHWQDVDIDLVRSYAAASGNRDPIHVSPFLARALGLPGAIMHGLWTLGRASSLLTPCEPPYGLKIQFRRPLVVPGRAGWALGKDGESFTVVSPEGGKPFALGSRYALARDEAR